MADAVVAGKAQQKTPDGYFNVERVLRRVITSKGHVLLCGTCMDARGIIFARCDRPSRPHAIGPITAADPVVAADGDT
jgi:uncharacterized protein involved in oxidation of intracellular sulfur